MYSYSPPIFLIKPDLSCGFGDTRAYFSSIAISVVRFNPNLAPRWTLRPKLPLLSPIWAGACHGFGSLFYPDSPSVLTAISGVADRQHLQQHLCRKVFGRRSRRSTSNRPAPKWTDISDCSIVFCLQSKRPSFTPTQIIRCHLNTASRC